MSKVKASKHIAKANAKTAKRDEIPDPQRLAKKNRHRRSRITAGLQILDAAEKHLQDQNGLDKPQLNPTWLKGLTDVERKIVLNYSGNLSAACRKAGVDPKNYGIYKNRAVYAAIVLKEKQEIEPSLCMDKLERMAFLATVAREGVMPVRNRKGEVVTKEVSEQTRMNAIKLLMQAEGDLVERSLSAVIEGPDAADKLRKTKGLEDRIKRFKGVSPDDEVIDADFEVKDGFEEDLSDL